MTGGKGTRAAEAAWAALAVGIGLLCAGMGLPAPALAPLSDDEHVARAIVQAKAGRTDAALEDVAAALALNPRHPQAHVAASLVAVQEGRDADAIRHLETYLMLLPQAPDAAGVRAEIARLRRKDGRP